MFSFCSNVYFNPARHRDLAVMLILPAQTKLAQLEKTIGLQSGRASAHEGRHCFGQMCDAWQLPVASTRPRRFIEHRHVPIWFAD
jgi:hypothetical protein